MLHQAGVWFEAPRHSQAHASSAKQSRKRGGAEVFDESGRLGPRPALQASHQFQPHAPERGGRLGLAVDDVGRRSPTFPTTRPFALRLGVVVPYATSFFTCCASTSLMSVW